MKNVLVFPAFLLSGFLSGKLIVPSDTHSFAIFYIAGLLFGATFLLVNGFIVKKTFESIFFIFLSTLAYFSAVMLCIQANAHMALVGLCGAAIVSIAALSLFKTHPLFALLAIAAGSALALLMYITKMKHENELAYTFSLWQGVVGTLLSVGTRIKYDPGQ